LAELGAQIIPGDITDPASFKEALSGCQVVYHAAGWVSEEGGSQTAWAVNVAGTHHLVDAALAAGVERFIHISTCGVYGSPQAFDIDETTSAKVTGNPYKDTKVAAEEIVFAAYKDHGLPVVVARPSQVYGPGSLQFTIRPVNIIKSGNMILVDGGRHLCKPVYIDNLVDGLILCAVSPAAVGEAINLTDGEPVTWRDFFGAYGRMLGVPSFPSVPYPAAWIFALTLETRAHFKGSKAKLTRDTIQSLRSKNSFSNRKAREILGWQPSVDLTAGMRKTELWLRAQGYLD
jgi:nucleoside-diphosphate-sugar epimerase